MYTEAQLAITDYQKQPLPNLFFRQKQDTQHLALVFPGMRYTTDMPTLYYLTLLLLARGADVLLVQHTYYQSMFRSFDVAAQINWLIFDAHAAYTFARHQRPYAQTTFVGQSLGTLALGSLVSHVPSNIYSFWILLAPLLTNTQLVAQLEALHHHAFFISGSNDRVYDGEVMERVKQNKQVSSLVLTGADHSLEFADDAVATSKAHTQILEEITRWLPERV